MGTSSYKNPIQFRRSVVSERDKKKAERARRTVSQKTRSHSLHDHVIAKGQTMTEAVELTAPPGVLTSIRDGDSWDCPDYFASEAAESGLFYLFYYCDVFVLFVPPSKEFVIAEMATGRTVLAAFGYSEEAKQEVWRLVFDDGSLNPLAMTVPFYGLGITSRKPEAGSNTRARQGWNPFVSPNHCGGANISIEVLLRLLTGPGAI